MSLTIDQYNQLQKRIQENNTNGLGSKINNKRTKYSNESKIVDGKQFSSKLEANCYSKLKALQQAGIVSYFLLQVPIRLPGDITYRVDFQVFFSNGTVEYWDAKGVATPVYIMKKKQVQDIYPIRIKEITRKDL